MSNKTDLQKLYKKNHDDENDIGFKNHQFFSYDDVDEDEEFKQSLKRQKNKILVENEHYQTNVQFVADETPETSSESTTNKEKKQSIFAPINPELYKKQDAAKKLSLRKQALTYPNPFLNNDEMDEDDESSQDNTNVSTSKKAENKNKKNIKFNQPHKHFENQKFNNTFKTTDLSDEEKKNLLSVIESILYLAGEDGASLNDFKNVVQLHHSQITDLLNQLQKEYETSDSGVVLVKFGEKYKVLTKPKNKDHLTAFVNEPNKMILNKTTLITLSIIAYNQPTTRAKIYSIRKKDPKSAIDTLLKHNLIIEAGRAPTLGSPILYKVSQKFFDLFGIKNISELPRLEKDFKDFNPIDEENWD
ncbi:SMC-Scp complex subunit ScpB [Ureaplasma miroungigenitalium]|uniref:SMC-Scp complex subunit ScpB n=1 Tax=Ureaplasma miroungigenitalium TaxID=1042321 RepID=UPI0021E9A154|nr:SMC-Scp complex subunit ScpB [Ureaplasma miroungigenitalium]MCV3734008.1 SMC-Scp complex subunit ScpB [Ureaplasma miroungigenitalium]